LRHFHPSTFGPLLAMAIALLLLQVSAQAQDTGSAEADATIRLDFPDNMEVKLLVDYVAARCGLNILYEESLVNKRVSILSPAAIPKESLEGFLRSVLKMVGLAMVDSEQSGWKQIVTSQNLLSATSGVRTDPGQLDQVEDTIPVAQVFHLRHVAPSAAEKVIRSLLSKPGGNSMQLAESEMLLVSDYASNVKRIAEVLQMVDHPGAAISVQFATVQHRSPADLVREATSLLSERKKLEGPAADREDVSLLPLVGRIAVVADESRHEEVLALLALLDVPSEGSLRQYRVHHTDPARVEKILRQMTPGDRGAAEYQCTVDAEAGLLLVHAPDHIHNRLEALLRELDVPSDSETRTYRFQHISPGRVERLVKELLGSELTRSSYQSATDADSGLLIVSAPPHIHERIESLKETLDVAETGTSASHAQFYKLMNAKAVDVLSTISAFQSGDQKLTAMVGRNQAGPASTSEQFTGPNAPPGRAGEPAPRPPSYQSSSATTKPADPSVATIATQDAAITADPNTNTLIVVASPDVQRIYKHLISILDKRRPQVMVEVTMVTLDTSDNFSLGVDLSRAGEIGKTAEYMVFSTFGLGEVDTSTGRLAITPGVGFNGAVVSPDVVDAVIRALASSGRTSVLSAPRILVNDNASATLASVSEAPFTSINASDTVSTTSFAGYASAGTTVTLTPQISEGDHVVLDYAVTLNSFTGDGGGGVPPPRQTNNVSSRVTVPDGHAVIVGGLKRKDTTFSVSKIPLLGDIPWLGYLFSSRSTSDAESTLFVFIRPVVLRDDEFEDLKYLSGRDRRLAGLPDEYPASDLMMIE
jgi:general secretion pathway protein D